MDFGAAVAFSWNHSFYGSGWKRVLLGVGAVNSQPPHIRVSGFVVNNPLFSTVR